MWWRRTRTMAIVVASSSPFKWEINGMSVPSSLWLSLHLRMKLTNWLCSCFVFYRRYNDMYFIHVYIMWCVGIIAWIINWPFHIKWCVGTGTTSFYRWSNLQHVPKHTQRSGTSRVPILSSVVNSIVVVLPMIEKKKWYVVVRQSIVFFVVLVVTFTCSTMYRLTIRHVFFVAIPVAIINMYMEKIA